MEEYNCYDENKDLNHIIAELKQQLEMQQKEIEQVNSDYGEIMKMQKEQIADLMDEVYKYTSRIDEYKLEIKEFQQ